jgi:glycerol-3-phosphate O-acyltransferase
MDRKNILKNVAQHYVEEISGHFDPQIYRMATMAVPFGFSWLLNAASVKRFLPWKMTESLQSRIRVVGEVPQLQKLAKKGTILMVPTHQSNIDSILVGYVIYLMCLPPFSYGAGLNLYSNPAFSFFMSRLGAYTVDRKKNNDIYKHALKNYSTEVLKQGIHTIFFPGGGRSRSGALETKLKLGLLGTALDAQIAGYVSGKPNPNIYVVPMVMSYHFVLEAASLIEDYLMEAGKHRYIIMDDESWQPTKVLRFFWKLFSSQTEITVRIGKAMDIFGNELNEEGESVGPNGTIIDPKKWLITRGEIRPEPQRDREYTRQLGGKIVERFHLDNTVITSHVVAFVLFEALRKKYPDLDLYRFLRLSLDQRSLPLSDFLSQAEVLHETLKEKARDGKLHLSYEMNVSDTLSWVKNGISQLGLVHENAVAKIKDDVIWTEDMNLLYFYRNRLTGYHLSLQSEQSAFGVKTGGHDEKGFLV